MTTQGAKYKTLWLWLKPKINWRRIKSPLKHLQQAFCILHPLFMKQISISSWKYTFFKIMSSSQAFEVLWLIDGIFSCSRMNSNWHSAWPMPMAFIQWNIFSTFTASTITYQKRKSRSIQNMNLMIIHLVWACMEYQLNVGIFPYILNNSIAHTFIKEWPTILTVIEDYPSVCLKFRPFSFQPTMSPFSLLVFFNHCK